MYYCFENSSCVYRMLRFAGINVFKTNLFALWVKQRFYSVMTSILMEYDTFGNADSNKPPLIIMHGLLGSRNNWHTFASTLAPKIKNQIFTVDARNHGDSPHAVVHDSVHMTEDVKVFMEAQNIPKAVVVGHSMGGRTMMYFTLKYPQLVDRAIILDISPNLSTKNIVSAENLLRAMTKVDVPVGFSYSDGLKVARKQLKEFLTDEADVDFALKNLKLKDSGEFIWAANVYLLLEKLSFLSNFKKELEAFPPHNGLVLFVGGTKSVYFSKSDEPAIKERFPNAEIKWIESGHLLHVDQPQQLIDVMTKFLNK